MYVFSVYLHIFREHHGCMDREHIPYYHRQSKEYCRHRPYIPTHRSFDTSSYQYHRSLDTLVSLMRNGTQSLCMLIAKLQFENISYHLSLCCVILLVLLLSPLSHPLAIAIDHHQTTVSHIAQIGVGADGFNLFVVRHGHDASFFSHQPFVVISGLIVA